MNIPEYKPSPLTERLTEIVKERNKLESARIFDYVETQFPHLKEVYTSLETAEIKSDEMSCFVKTMRILLFQLSGKENFFNRRTNAGQIRKHLIEIFNCPYEFDCKISSIRSDASEYALSDEQNIATTIFKQKIVGIEELKLIRNLINDFLEMIGQLARRIQSCEMKRILRSIVAVKGKPWYSENLDSKDSERLADDIIYCYEAVKSEIRLLSPADRVALVFPKIPSRRPDIIIETNPPSHLPTEEKTEYCRNIAYKQFKKDYFHLLPFIDFKCDELDYIKQTEESIETIANSYKNKKPTLDKGEDRFNYEILGEVLGADFRLYYDRYFIDKDYDEDRKQFFEYENRDDVIENTSQEESKKRIIVSLKKILSVAIKLCAECGSIASEDWTAAQLKFESRDGDFHSYSSDDDDAAAADLEEFLTRFRRGRQRLWADWNRHCRNDIIEKPIPTEPQGKLVDEVHEINANSAQTALNTIPKSDSRAMVIALVRKINEDLFGGNSIPKAVKYIRFEKDVNLKYARHVEEARIFANCFVNSASSKRKDEDSFWNGIEKDAQPRSVINAAKRKARRNSDPLAPPGAEPILWNNSGGGLC